MFLAIKLGGTFLIILGRTWYILFETIKTKPFVFHYTRASDRFRLRNIDHVLFNMATGSGKTDLMAALILYLYQEHNYQNFLFLVNTNSVLSKTVDNLITVVSDKYLYRHPIEVEGERVEIRKVNSFHDLRARTPFT